MRKAVLVAGCVLFALPFVFMVAGSLRAPGLPPPDGFEVFPADPTTMSYEVARSMAPLGTQFRNSLLVCAVAVPVTVLVGSWAGFAVVTGSRGVRRAVIVASAGALMVPAMALWVPRFALYRALGVLDTLVPLMAPALMATTPLSVLLFALAYRRIPPALFEVARLEGLTAFATWRRVAWPLGRPAAFAVAALAGVWHWSNAIDPLLYAPGQSVQTVAFGLRGFAVLEPALHPVFLAAAVLAVVPPIIAFVLAQKALFERTV